MLRSHWPLRLTNHVYYFRNGYSLVKSYEVYHWPKKSGDIFKSYIQYFMKMKVEASGFPRSCDTQEKKDNFIVNYKEKEGIELDPSQMVKDPSKKAFEKLCLNNLWGFLAKNCHGVGLHFVSTGRELLNLLDDSTLECTAFNVNSKTILVNTKRKEAFHKVFSD